MKVRRTRSEVVMLEVERQCLVCEFKDRVAEPEGTDPLGPLCSRCHAPTERTAVLGRRVERAARNLHAAALAELGARKGGLARAAVLTPKRRREIARAAARARWDQAGIADTSR